RVVPFRHDDEVVIGDAVPELVVAVLFDMNKVTGRDLGVGETGGKGIIAIVADQLPLVVDRVVFGQIGRLLMEEFGDEGIVAFVVLGLRKNEQIARHLTRRIVAQGLPVDIGVLVEGTRIVFQIEDIGVFGSNGKDGVQGVIGKRGIVVQRFFVAIVGIDAGIEPGLVGHEIPVDHAVLDLGVGCRIFEAGEVQRKKVVVDIAE